IIPFVNRRGDVEPLVTLQPDQSALQRRCQYLGDLGLANPSLTLEKQRPVKVERQMDCGREAAIGDVIGAAEQRQRIVDRRGKSGGGAVIAHPNRSWPQQNRSPTGRGGQRDVGYLTPLAPPCHPGRGLAVSQLLSYDSIHGG